MVAPLLLALLFSAPSLRVVTMGGGPAPEMNQVAIESNVRYVSSLLPAGTQHTVLFADGGNEKPVVQFEARPDELSAGATIVRGLFGDGPSRGKASPWLHYRPTSLTNVNGPLVKSSVSETFTKLASESAQTPLLLYFTGHGSPNQNDLENNWMDLWSSGQLQVADLKAELRKLPARRPVTIVMVQCHSGSFANLVLDPDLQDRPLCGFFAAPKERVAAGCTPSVLEEDYKDFTSYFFAALTGKDRVGRVVTKPDYNKDGKVGGDEALAYAQMADESIDVPLCTSDVFLRKAQDGAERDMTFVDRPFSEIRALASPLHKRVLDSLREKLGSAVAGEDCLKVAVSDMNERATNGMRNSFQLERTTIDKLNEGRKNLLEKFPGLRSRTSSEWNTAAQEAVTYLDGDEATRQPLVAAIAARDAAEKKNGSDEVYGARMLRFLREAKTVYLESKLRKSGDKALIARFEKLRKRESESPLG
ncbi:MAG: hypothetical protein QM758_18210 [Armatimonas sp.]